MARIRILGIGALGAVALAMVVPGDAWAKEKNGGTPPTVWRQWSVPFTCGLNGGEVERAVPGTYAAAVDILNVGALEVMFTKHVALTYPPVEQEPGAVSAPVIEALPGGSALQVDCGEILGPDFVFPTGAPATPYVQGFVVVRAHAELDVAVTQTATGATGEVSVDVERVEGRVVEGSPVAADSQVDICHVPPGNPAAAHSLVVGAPAVPAHLGHGDSLGACP
jgi:hypothetical protein